MLKQWCRKIERLLIARFVVNISAKNCQNHVDLCMRSYSNSKPKVHGTFSKTRSTEGLWKNTGVIPIVMFNWVVFCSCFLFLFSRRCVSVIMLSKYEYTTSTFIPFVMAAQVGIGQAIIFLPCGFFFYLLLFRFFSPNLSGRRVDVCHTSTHGVALVRI